MAEKGTVVETPHSVQEKINKAYRGQPRPKEAVDPAIAILQAQDTSHIGPNISPEQLQMEHSVNHAYVVKALTEALNFVKSRSYYVWVEKTPADTVYGQATGEKITIAVWPSTEGTEVPSDQPFWMSPEDLDKALKKASK